MNVLQKSRLMRSSHNGRSFWESCQISKVYIRSHEIINEPSTSSKHENTVNRMATHLKSNYDTKKNSSGIKLWLKIMITVTWYDFTSVKLHCCVRKRRSSWVRHSDVSSTFRWLLVISPFFLFDKSGLSMSNRDKGTVTRTSAVLHWRERNNIRGWRGHKHDSHLSYLLMHVLYSLSNTFFTASSQESRGKIEAIAECESVSELPWECNSRANGVSVLANQDALFTQAML